MSDPLISVVVACLNDRVALEQTLRGMETDGFPQAEWVVVDGGSTDGTRTILERLSASKKERFRFVSERDGGVYDAYNKGARLARGEYLYFTGTGDVVRPGALAQMAAHFRRRPEVVYGDVFNKEFGARMGGRFSRRRVAQAFMWHQGIFYHREVFERCGGYRERYPLYADADLNIRGFSLEGVEWRYVDLVVADYLGGGMSSTGRDPRYSDEVGATIREYLGESVARAYSESGFEFDLYLRSHHEVSLIVVAEDEDRAVVEQTMAGYVTKYQNVTHFRFVARRISGPSHDPLTVEVSAGELEGIDAVVVFSGRPLASSTTDSGVRLIKGTYLPYRDDLFERLLSEAWGGVYIFGAGAMGEALVRQMCLVFRDRGGGVPVKGFWDNDPAKWGQRLEGVLVSEPLGEKLGDRDGVLVASYAWRDLVAQLEAGGVSGNQVVVAL